MQVELYNPKAFASARAAADQSRLSPCTAVIDTGAYHSCITPSAAKAAGIESETELETLGVHGKQTTKLYEVGLFVSGLGMDITKMDVSEMTDLNDDIEAILGMDILSRGVFHYASPNHFVFCV